MKFLVFFHVWLLVFVLCSSFVFCRRPAVVNIGAIFTFNSVIGRASKSAMEVATSDINSDSSILSGTELKLVMKDANCSVFMGSVGGIFHFFILLLFVSMFLILFMLNVILRLLGRLQGSCF